MSRTKKSGRYVHFPESSPTESQLDLSQIRLDARGSECASLGVSPRNLYK